MNSLPPVALTVVVALALFVIEFVLALCTLPRTERAFRGLRWILWTQAMIPSLSLLILVGAGLLNPEVGATEPFGGAYWDRTYFAALVVYWAEVICSVAALVAFLFALELCITKSTRNPS